MDCAVLDTICPGLPTQEGWFRTRRELTRQVRRLAGPDRSELQVHNWRSGDAHDGTKAALTER